MPAAVAAAVERLRGGRVVVRDESAARIVWFAGGRVHALTSEAERERLGGWLVERGVAASAAVQRALALAGNGRRLGQLLVRAGVLDETTVRAELRSLAYTIAARLVAAGGTVAAEPGTGMPVDARTVELLPAGLFPEAMLRTPDLDLLADLVGRGAIWEAVGTAVDPAVELSEAQRYLLTLLRPAKSLDTLRRVVVADYADLVRDVSVLAAAGLVVPRASYGAARPGSGPTTAAIAQAHAASPPHALPPRLAGDSRLRAALAEIEREDQARVVRTGYVGPDGPLAGAELHRAERLLSAAEQQRAGGDLRGARRALAYAVEVVPCAVLLVRLGELELADPGTRSCALERLRQALALAPDFAAGWQALADYWRQRGEAEKERRCREKIAVLGADGAMAATRA